MNCQPGDLALIIRGPERIRGMMVRCIRIEDPPMPSGARIHPPGPYWRVDRNLLWVATYGSSILRLRENHHIPYCADSYLFPIRPEPDEEEVPTVNEVHV